MSLSATLVHFFNISRDGNSTTSEPHQDWIQQLLVYLSSDPTWHTIWWKTKLFNEKGNDYQPSPCDCAPITSWQGPETASSLHTQRRCPQPQGPAQLSTDTAPAAAAARPGAESLFAEGALSREPTSRSDTTLQGSWQHRTSVICWPDHCIY